MIRAAILGQVNALCDYPIALLGAPRDRVVQTVLIGADWRRAEDRRLHLPSQNARAPQKQLPDQLLWLHSCISEKWCASVVTRNVASGTPGNGTRTSTGESDTMLRVVLARAMCGMALERQLVLERVMATRWVPMVARPGEPTQR